MRLALLTFVVSIAYLPLPSYSTAGRWAAMAAICVLLWQDRPRIGPGHVLGLVFVAWCFLSLFWAVERLDGFNEFYHLLLIAGVFVVASTEIDLRPMVIALGCGTAISAVIALLQLNGYQPVNAATAGGAGLFLNKDFFAQVASPSLLLSTGFGLWVFVPGALFGVIATSSHAAWIATIIGGLVLVWGRLTWTWRGVLIGTFVLGTGVAFWFDLIRHADQMPAINDRLAFWQFTIANLTWLGYGFGTYPALWPKWEHAHNEFLELAFEIGVGVLPLIGVFIYALGASVSTAARAALASLLVSALVYFPFHEPTTAFLAALLAGHLCGARDRLRVAQPESRIYSWEGARDTEPLGTGALCRADLSRADLSVRSQFTECS